jgi:hypothetical protein
MAGTGGEVEPVAERHRRKSALDQIARERPVVRVPTSA